jgi:tRNA-specific 2-thiouridylase
LKKVLLGMSGGVDSSVSAYLLQKEGYEVEGVYMKLHNASKEYHEKNLETIEKVASFLNIKYHIVDLSDAFRSEVYDYFVSSYIDGTTPNPCVKCNRTIKFGRLLEFAKEIGADYLATGHYVKCDGEFFYEADDSSKDQSYFLAQVDKSSLPNLIFPMSRYQKDDIKKIASHIEAFKHLAVSKESQEICFVEDTYVDILRKYIDVDMSGDTLDSSGNIVGNHKGYMHYTIGKRRGFFVRGAHEPHFVKAIDPIKNQIVVGKKSELEVNHLTLKDLNIYVDDTSSSFSNSFECSVKLRYRSTPTRCKVKILDKMAEVELYEPVFGVASGQLAVFYDDSKVIGSGWIASVI